MNSGTYETIGTAPLSPMTLCNQPYWKIAVSTPQEAPIESGFMTAACGGTTTVRKARIKSTKLSEITTRICSGSLLEVLDARSS